MSGRRAAARVARRELRRRPATTALVIVLVALPVALMVLGVALARTEPLPGVAADQAAVGNGQASLATPLPEAESAEAAIRAAAPEVEIAEVLASNGSLAPVDGPERSTTVLGGDFTDPIIRDRYLVTAGNLPSTPGELVLSPRLAEAWDVEVGDHLDLPEIATSGPVVGIAHTVGWRGSSELLTGAFPALAPDTVAAQLFIDQPGGLAPATLDVLERLEDGPASVQLRSDVASERGAVRSSADPDESVELRGSPPSGRWARWASPSWPS